MFYSSRGSAGATSTAIGDRRYKKTVLRRDTVCSRILVDHSNNVVYKNADNRLFLWNSEKCVAVAGLLWTRDIAMDGGGTIWIGTKAGMYKYNHNTNTATIFSDKNIWKMCVSANGVLHVVDWPGGQLHAMHDDTLQRLDGIDTVWNAAFNKGGDLYLTNGLESNVYLMKAGLREKGLPIKGLPPGKVAQLEVDRRDDYLYICHEKGLFCLRPDADRVNQVEGFGKVSALGLDDRGNIYLGADGNLIKMVYQNPSR